MKILKAFNQLIENIGNEYRCVRLQIREDENFGEAIIEAPNGCPQDWFYNNKTEDWE